MVKLLPLGEVITTVAELPEAPMLLVLPRVSIGVFSISPLEPLRLTAEFRVMALPAVICNEPPEMLLEAATLMEPVPPVVKVTLPELAKILLTEMLLLCVPACPTKLPPVISPSSMVTVPLVVGTAVLILTAPLVAAEV